MNSFVIQLDRARNRLVGQAVPENQISHGAMCPIGGDTTRIIAGVEVERYGCLQWCQAQSDLLDYNSLIRPKVIAQQRVVVPQIQLALVDQLIPTPANTTCQPRFVIDSPSIVVSFVISRSI